MWVVPIAGVEKKISYYHVINVEPRLSLQIWTFYLQCFKHVFTRKKCRSILNMSIVFIHIILQQRTRHSFLSVSLVLLLWHTANKHVSPYYVVGKGNLFLISQCLSNMHAMPT